MSRAPAEPTAEDLGEPYRYDQNFRGIDRSRKCTDVCMLIFFLLFICCEAALFGYAYVNSNVNYLYTPTDHRELFCGYNNANIQINGTKQTDLPDLTSKPYLFWVRPGKKGYARSFCVESCPTSGSFAEVFAYAIANSSYFPYGLSYNGSCGSNSTATIHNYSITNTSESDGYFCPYKSELFAMRCFPNITDVATEVEALIANVTSSFSGTGYLISAFNDIKISYVSMLIAVAASLVLSIIWLLALRCTAGFFVWITVILSMAALGALTWILYEQKVDGFSNVTAATAYTFGLWSSSTNTTVFTVLFWVMIGIDAIFLLVLLFLCDRIKLSIGIIEVTSKVFGTVFSMFIFPAIFYIFFFAWWVFVAYCAIVLFGAGYPTREYDSDRQVDRLLYSYTYTIEYMSIYHFFAFIWISVFICDHAEMTISGVCASYYFNREPRRRGMGHVPLIASWWRSLWYHTGSLATGSLIIAICKVIRYCLEYISEKTKGTQSTAMKFLLKCLICCFWCLEKFLKYLNRNVYIWISVHGDGFWKSCKTAFQLLLRNCVRVASINWVGTFTLFLGRIFVCFGITAGYVYYLYKCTTGITFILVPSVIVFILSFIASGAYTGLFDIGIDTLFLCFLEDEERNDGTPGHEPFAPPELKKHIDRS